MESATRRTTRSRKFLSGLAKYVKKNVLISLYSIYLASWNTAKEKGERFFKAEYSGSYRVFNQRPIPEGIILYYISDPFFLREFYNLDSLSVVVYLR